MTTLATSHALVHAM